MKKLLLIATLLVLSCGAFAQQTFADISQEAAINQTINQALAKKYVAYMINRLPKDVQKKYNKLPHTQQLLINQSFVEMIQAQDALSVVNFPRRLLPTDLVIFLQPFNDIRDLHISFDAQTDASLVMTAALKSLEFKTQDGKVLDLEDFLIKNQDTLENYDSIIYSHMVLWSAHLTLDGFELN